MAIYPAQLKAMVMIGEKNSLKLIPSGHLQLAAAWAK